MWLMKTILLVSFTGYIQSLVNTQHPISMVHRHVIEVTDISSETQFPDQNPTVEEEMLARSSDVYKTIKKSGPSYPF